MCRKMMNDVRMVNDYILTVQKFDDYGKDKRTRSCVCKKERRKMKQNMNGVYHKKTER